MALNIKNEEAVRLKLFSAAQREHFAGQSVDLGKMHTSRHLP